MKLASYIDHTLLKADTSEAEIEQLCNEAKEHNFVAVCVPPYFVRKCKQWLKDSDVKIATVVGFPLGYAHTPAKVEEARRAIDEGANEIDMVINIIALKANDLNYLKNELTSAATIVQLRGGKLKVILETGLLTQEEMLRACKLCTELSVDYVKTSTGFIEKGATVEDVKFLRANLPKSIKIKASGGIKTKEDAEALIKAGADRIGTSRGVALVK
ncbi:MAG: deoxyribose-phosphate aldolase [Chitinophagales bacterium]|nr:deoxyribose-phosphate aldolase [Chitinophagales bacterium]MCO5279916.1 deoxyribose-phosphate aldolase [Chitinophagales bacterium]OJV30599.1 MAG: deoxyribose-phosphate aldolase [Bacteroidetes bacterium 37-13]HRN95537.1 deoxyribose-phosphate aldolase [Chitinophagales bacterium]HRP38914.1 deoxyribose-phosphate aldolase [Chitinophagales bacterium]